MPSIYLIGSLQNIPKIIEIGNSLRKMGWDPHDEWVAGGPECDVKWREYEQARGRPFVEAIRGRHARMVFETDSTNILRCDVAAMILPAGKSGHLELGWAAGKRKPTYIVLDDDPSHYDVMYGFSTVLPNVDALYEELSHWPKPNA